jgi:hypothetical protein
VHEVWDYAANTRTLDMNEPLVVAGPHDIFFSDGIDPAGCVALAA